MAIKWRNGTEVDVEKLKAGFPGWGDLLDRLFADLAALGWSGTVLQVKEKFGGLRVYVAGADEAVMRRISEAEEESFRVG